MFIMPHETRLQVLVNRATSLPPVLIVHGPSRLYCTVRWVAEVEVKSQHLGDMSYLTVFA